jgi:hypothetical protein
MRGKWGAAAALGASTVLGVGAAAIAGGGGGPRVEPVEAAITYTHLVVNSRSCEGPGGEIAEERVRVTGTSTGDPRLTGNVTVRLRDLFKVETNDEFQRGTLVIRNPRTGRKKVVARFADAGTGIENQIFQGVLVGSVRNGNLRLIANWRTTFHANGAVTAQIGGITSDARLPAVVFRGHCTGPFERFEIDLPPPRSGRGEAVIQASRGLAHPLRP